MAREAGVLLMDYFRQHVKIEYKGDVDLVTVADRESEALILERIRAQFPTHDVIGEEGTRIETGSEYKWYVDPLDGTTNFAHGFPVFCVSMGLERRAPSLAAGQDEEIVAGVVYDPLRDELFTAEKGKGAYLNGAPIHVSHIAHLAEALLATGFPSRKRHDNPNIHFYQQFTLRSHGVRRAGSAALDLAYTACGRVDAFWEFNLNPWDTSAGAALVVEAGGTMSGFDGSPFRLDSKEVLATNGLLRDELLGFFAEMFAGHVLEDIPTPAEFAARRAQRGAS